MRQISRVKAQRGGAGEALPAVFQKLHQAGVRPLLGQVTMIAAPPNAGKSFFALYWAGRLAQKFDMPVLYFSADTDEHDTVIRATSLVTQERSRVVEQALSTGNGWDHYSDELDSLKTMRFDFETDPTYDYMSDVTLAYAEAWGDYPKVIVIDNVMNVVTFAEDDYKGMKDVTKFAKRLARQTGACVFLLHHMNEGSLDPRYPAPRDRITGKVAQLPELILSLGMDDEFGILRVAAVKHRGGAKSANGHKYIEFYVDVDRMAIFESEYDRAKGIAA